MERDEHCLVRRRSPRFDGRIVKVRSYEQLFVGGRWQDATGGRIDVISPHTEEVIAHAAAGSAQDVDMAVRMARSAFDDGPWPRLSHAERIAAVEELAAVYSTHIDDMADLITAEMGSPASFSRLGQAAGAATLMRLAAQSARTFPWAERSNGLLGEVHLRRSPVGVVGIIIPWNVPQNLLMPKLIPALIAGCTVVIKPAPETPLDSLWVAEMIEQIGLPEGVVSVVPGGREVGEELVRASRCRQDRLHRELRHRTTHRVAVRRAAQAIQPGTGRQVRRDRPRRRTTSVRRWPGSRWPA